MSLLLDDEKRLLQRTVADKIGASPEELRRAFDTSKSGEKKQAALYAKKVVQRMGASSDRAMERHLQRVTDRLVKPLNTQGFKFRVILVDEDQANAFTPGGGVIVVQEGLLMYTDTEGQVAAVLAHEIAHVLRRDPKRMQQFSLAKKAGGSFVSAITPDALEENVAKVLKLGGKATINAAIRAQEAEADSVGIDIMAAAGYDPKEMVSMQRQMRQIMPQQSRLANMIYGQHPLSKDREANAREKIAKFYPLTRGDVTSTEFERLIRKYAERRQKQLAAKL